MFFSACGVFAHVVCTQSVQGQHSHPLSIDEEQRSRRKIKKVTQGSLSVYSSSLSLSGWNYQFLYSLNTHTLSHSLTLTHTQSHRHTVTQSHRHTDTQQQQTTSLGYNFNLQRWPAQRRQLGYLGFISVLARVVKINKPHNAIMTSEGGSGGCTVTPAGLGSRAVAGFSSMTDRPQ